MPRLARLLLAAAVLAILAALAGPAVAQDKKDAARRLQQINQKLAADKAALEREKAALARDKAELTQERDALKEDAGKLKGAAARKAAEAKKLAEEGEKLRADLAAAAEREAVLKAELAKTAESLQSSQRTAEQLGKRLANQGETSGHWQAKTQACEGKNVELADLNGELLERYRNKGCAEALGEAEPFFGVRRARLENLIEEYKDRIGAARFRAADELKEKAK
jgi:chromosome segregation ATPase